MLPKSQKYGQNNKNTSKITKIRAKYGGFFPNARIYELTRINTGDFGTLALPEHEPHLAAVGRHPALVVAPVLGVLHYQHPVLRHLVQGGAILKKT